MNRDMETEVLKLANELKNSSQLYDRINWLDTRNKENPLVAFLASYHPDQHTKAAMEYLGMSDCDFQEYAEQVIWELFTQRVAVEMALEVIGARNHFSEVA